MPDEPDDPAEMGSTRRPHVLLVAYSCGPGHISEAAVGWHRALLAARMCDTWVLCPDHPAGEHIRTYQEAHGPTPGLSFVFVPHGRVGRLIRRLPGGFYVTYNLWQRRAARVARSLHAALRFDLTHQVTLCGYREPGYLWRLDVPFVWGPVGGTQNLPWRYLGQLGVSGAVSEAVRNVLNTLQLRFSSRVRRAARRSAALLSANSTVHEDLRRAHGVVSRVQLETGVPDTPRPRSARRSSGPLRILWASHCYSFKALPLLLRALSRLPSDVPYELTVVGDGPARRAWQRLARRLDIDRHIRWLGWLPHGEVLACYEAADVFVFTSLRDTSGNVVLEALAAGVPIICLDHQGVRDIVTDTCGIKVPVTNPATSIHAIARALQEVAHDRHRLRRLGDGALERAGALGWSVLGSRLLEVYAEVLGRSTRTEGTMAGPARSARRSPRTPASAPARRSGAGTASRRAPARPPV